jgi:hypothetical protein
VLELRRLVQREVRRRNHGNRVCTDLGGVSGQRSGVGGRLRAGVDRDLEAPGGGLDEELGCALPLRDRQQDPLAVRPEREQAVQPAGDEEVRHRTEAVLVERRPTLRKRRDRGGEHSLQHAGDSTSR